jgi:hypothetical protein
MDGLDAGGCTQSEGELNGGHRSCYLMHLSGGIFLISIREQEELVLGVCAVMSGGFLSFLDAIKIMVKLAGNLTVWIRMYDVSKIL